jgi:hypothetical protein
VKSIQIQTKTGGRRPLLGRLHRCALSPFVECRYQLPCRTRGSHIPHILVPPPQVPWKEYRLPVLPEPWAYRITVLTLRIGGNSRRILVPAIRLVGTTQVPGEYFQHDVSVHSRCHDSLLPSVYHATTISSIGIYKYHKPPVHPKV